MGTVLKFIEPTTGTPVPELLEDATIFGSTCLLDVGGVTIEHGVTKRFEPDGIATVGHLVSMNMAPRPLLLDRKFGRDFRQVKVPPRGFFVQPAGEPMSVRTPHGVHFCAIEIPRPWVTRVLGRDLALRPQDDRLDGSLASLVHLLAAELARRCESGPLYTESLAIAFVTRLHRLLGGAEPSAPRKGLSGERLQQVREHIESRLSERVLVEDLAQIAGLSLAHFSREFKKATGQTPHAYVMTRRLWCARRLLAAGHTIAEAASRSGFADQAHFSRVFRLRFGTTPGACFRSR